VSGPIRVLIADDQRVVREGLALVLGLLPDVDVVGAVCVTGGTGRARSGPQAVQPAQLATLVLRRYWYLPANSNAGPQ
jgi:DNA-binding NarL/FixJ family response regulator